MLVIVHLVAATICFSGSCYPALVGKKTPTGEFNLVRVMTDQPGYGGEILAFAQDDSTLYAIHRVWLLSPKQHRDRRIASNNPTERVGITGGCVNVTPDVYEKLPSTAKLTIEN